jgi:hypothetical protein
MRDNGFAYHTPTLNECSAPSGSGSFLYERYIEHSLADLLWILPCSSKLKKCKDK